MPQDPGHVGKDHDQAKATDGRSRTEHVFEGAPDARQSLDPSHRVSRFRPTFRPLSPEEKALHDLIKLKAAELESLIDQIALRGVVEAQTLGAGYKGFAMKDLESAVMWAVKALTA